MEFVKYQHVERFGTVNVEGIEIGKTYVFPKVDGTNASVWYNNGEVCAGSRNRELDDEKDNAGFYKQITKDEKIIKFLTDNPQLRLYGEFLVPHSLKTYKDTAWRQFYVFDVVDTDGTYLTYEEYQPLMEKYNLEYIPPISIITNGTYEQFIKCLDKNQYLIKNGEGSGEGIVIKNYDFVNKFGRVTWAKIVTSEFKEKHTKAMGPSEIVNTPVEQQIIEHFCTKALVEKEYAKLSIDGWESKMIPRLLSTIFNCIINEEMWNILKKFKNPTINFKTLNTFCIAKIKRDLPEVF